MLKKIKETEKECKEIDFDFKKLEKETQEKLYKFCKKRKIDKVDREFFEKVFNKILNK